MIRKMITAVVAATALNTVAEAQTDDTVCGAYSAFGGIIASEMLDLTLRDIIGTIQGARPDITAKIGAAVEKGMTAQEQTALSKLSDADGTLLGEAAGGHSINLLMGGQAGSSGEVRSMMLADCKSLGYKTVITNQREMNKLMRGR